jgi:hypothetical protein
MMTEFMREVNTIFIFFYFLIKAVPAFFEFLACFMEFVFKRMDKKNND